LWNFASITSWDQWFTEDSFAFGVSWAVEWNTLISRATFIRVNKLFSFSEFIASNFSGTGWFLSHVSTFNGTILFTDTWLADIGGWDRTNWVLDTFVFTESTSASLVFTATLVGSSSLTATWFTFFVFTFDFQ